jgi:catechol 2,3-dioxygenase-like lactoylglutathione lyase family enzyme
MTVPLTSVGAVTLFVEDSQRSKSFYRRVFDLPVAYEHDDATGFKLENTIINLLEIPAARALIGPAPVADQDSGWGMRTAAFSDPDGHIWEVAQELPPNESS